MERDLSTKEEVGQQGQEGVTHTEEEGLEQDLGLDTCKVEEK